MTIARFRELRRRVLAATGSARATLLRRYLKEKARRGVWDVRYFAYNGVDPNVTPKLKRAAMRAYAAGLVPTSTTGGVHAPGSYHGQRDERGRGRAIDIGNRRELIGTAEGRRRMIRFQHAELARGGYVEVIGPDNGAVVLRGQRTTLIEGTDLEQMHDTHVHLADAS